MYVLFSLWEIAANDLVPVFKDVLNSETLNMGSGSCAVASCTNTRYNTKAVPGIVFHRFPKFPALAKAWESKCKRGDKINPENAVVCSQHFTDNDYERDLRVSSRIHLSFYNFLKSCDWKVND
jgi:hypothetical protein